MFARLSASSTEPECTLTAGPHEAAVEVEVVGVGGVELGAEGYAEIAAGAPVCLVQELGFLAFALPVLEHGDRAAVGKREARDVDGIAGGVLAAHTLPK